MNLLLAGATGLVGRHTLLLALDDPRVERVVAPTRRPLPTTHPKLLAPTVSFDHLPEDAHWWRADAAICALGTTMRSAGSREAFRRVDHDYPLAIARLSHRHGTPVYVLNSAKGANVASRFFYNRTKGEVERAMQDVGFPSLTLVRPGLIGGHREVRRPAEHAASVLLGALAPILPPGWRINPAERIAGCLLEAALSAVSGTHVVASDRLH